MKRGQRGRPSLARQMAAEPAQQASPSAAEGPVTLERDEKGVAVAKKTPGKAPTKRKLVEAYLAEHPRERARAVAEAILREHGVSVTPTYVHMIRSRRRKGRGRRKKAIAAAKEAPQEVAPVPQKSPLDRMLVAEREALVRRLDAIDTLLKGR